MHKHLVQIKTTLSHYTTRNNYKSMIKLKKTPKNLKNTLPLECLKVPIFSSITVHL